MFGFFEQIILVHAGDGAGAIFGLFKNSFPVQVTVRLLAGATEVLLASA